MSIIVDAMGGDNAPEAVVAGAAEAARELALSITLTGHEDALRPLLSRFDAPEGIRVVHTPEVVGMGETPMEALRHKPDSSLSVGLRLLKEGEGDAFVSAGNSGAVMAGALLTLGRIAGVQRPALAALFSSPHGPVLLIDAGANADCEPIQLLQFAQMGAIYMERVVEIASPRVGLLSNGEEPTKGNALTRKAHELLAASSLRFIGNVEGRHLAEDVVDVVVTDGFTGNIVLKVMEGVAAALFQLLREAVESQLHYRAAALVLQPALRGVRRLSDYAEYGGVPLLGVAGTVIMAHGRSDARAIKNAIRAAQRAADQGVVQAIQEGLRATPTGKE